MTARASNASPTVVPVPLTYALIPPAFRGDAYPPNPTSWLAPTYDSLWSNLTAFRQYNINLVGGGSVNGPATSPSFQINEKALAGYGQVNFKFEAGSTSIDGIVGLRAVRTTDSLPTTITSSSGPTAVTLKDRYTDWLPNANLNIHFSNEWVLRLAATKTRTKPRFQDLNPTLSLAPPVTGCNPQTTCLRNGSGGNPSLRPFTSENYDASLEYYFSRTGYATIGAFHRDLKGFIENAISYFPDPTASGVTLAITGPVNTDKGKVDGLEAQVRTFFDWDFLPGWARSFGIDANVTRINARADVRPVGSFTVRLPLQDVSKWNYNITGMYEKGPLSLRLSYSWRGPYPEGALANNGNYTLQGYAHPSPRLDLSATFNVTDKASVFFDWTNIRGRPFTSDIVRTNYNLPAGTVASTEVFPMVVRFEERIVSLGFRFNFAGPKR